MKTIAFALISVLLLALAACASDRQTVRVTARDYSIELTDSTLVAGDASFVVTNDGPTDHEFVILKTKLPPDQLPIRDGEWVDELAPGIEVVGEFDHVLPGKTKTLDVTLEPGSYIALSNRQGDYQKGMYSGFTAE